MRIISTDSSIDFNRSWLRLLQDAELAKNYARPYMLGGVHHLIKNPLLEALLPSLLYIRLVSLFDEALALYIDSKNLKMSVKKTLHFRIIFLEEGGHFDDAQGVKAVENKRAELAHSRSKDANWQDLDDAINIMEKELQNWRLVGERPQYKYFGERSAARKSEKPGYHFEYDYEFGIKIDEEKLRFYKSTVSISKD